MSESTSSLSGLRYARLVRCSTDPQADTSIPDQIAVLDDCAKKMELVHAGDTADFILPGISGSHPAARSDIEQIIRRKQEINDFDVLLVQDISRLTRAGTEHGGKLEYDLAAAGIRLIFAGAQLPEGDHAGILKSVEYYAAQQFAKSVSFGAARGQMSAILDGRQPHCLRPPFAVDRLYLSADGWPLCIVRNRTDGTQQKLDPQTHAVLQSYPKPVKGKTPMRYRKQAGERITLIPGAPEDIETVRRMFTRLLINGWGDWRIAKELNDCGLLSPNGKRWTRNAVKMVLRNPIYTGIGLANRRPGARYHQRSNNAPKKLAYDLTAIASQKRPPNRQRPRSEWVEQRHPALEAFLGPELRERAIAFQAGHLAGKPKGPVPKKDKHVDSLFLLKGILYAKQGNLPMTGRTQGTKQKPYRYYHPSRSQAYPCTDRTLRRTVRAEPIEQAVLQVIRELFIYPTIRDQIVQVLKKENSGTNVNSGELERLKREQAELEAQIEFVIDELGTIGRNAAKRKLQQLEAKLTAINTRIASQNPHQQPSEETIELMANAVVKRLTDIAASLDLLPLHALRELIASVVGKLEVDLESGAVSLELALPGWALGFRNSIEAQLGLDGNFLQTVAVGAQRQNQRTIAAIDCVAEHRSCYECRRRVA